MFTSSRLEASTFFDHGEHAGRMFFYGNMNETAFESTIRGVSQMTNGTSMMVVLLKAYHLLENTLVWM
jgi:hypothetical protein